MGWSIFKPIKICKGIRLNVSKSGIGMSGGVKGARVSVGTRGTEINAGRGGLRYRKKLSSSATDEAGEGGDIVTTAIMLCIPIVLAIWLPWVTMVGAGIGIIFCGLIIAGWVAGFVSPPEETEIDEEEFDEEEEEVEPITFKNAFLSTCGMFYCGGLIWYCTKIIW